MTESKFVFADNAPNFLEAPIDEVCRFHATETCPPRAIARELLDFTATELADDLSDLLSNCGGTQEDCIVSIDEYANRMKAITQYLTDTNLNTNP